jgi:hypothetical protein
MRQFSPNCFEKISHEQYRAVTRILHVDVLLDYIAEHRVTGMSGRDRSRTSSPVDYLNHLAVRRCRGSLRVGDPAA